MALHDGTDALRAQLDALALENERLQEELEKVRAEFHTQAEGAAARLKLSEELFAKSFANLPDSITLTTPADGVIVEANEGFERVFGFSREEWLGKSTLELDVWADPEDRKRMLTILKRDGRLRDFRTVGRMKSGRLFDAELSAELIETYDGRWLLTLARDVTERLRVEKERSEALARFSGFAAASQYGMGIADLDGHIVYVNPTLANMLGEEAPEACIGKHFPTAYYPEAMARRLQNEAMPALMKDGHWQGELELKAADGRSIPTDENYFVIRDGAGDPRYLGDILTDITERKRAEEALRKGEAQLAAAMEMAHLGHWEYDVVKDLFTLTDQLYMVFGTTAQAVGGYTMSSQEYAERFVHPEDRILVGEDVQRAIETADPEFSRRLEHRILYEDGAVGFVSVLFRIEKDNQGRTVRTYGVNQDITTRKEAEEERDALREQLTQAQKMESIGRLAGGVAHDFNNLLTVIRGFSDLLGESLDERDPLSEDVILVQDAVDSAARLTEQLLAFSRKQIVSPKVVDLNQEVRQAEKMLRRIIGEDVRFRFSAQEDMAKVHIDPGQIDQILVNLAVNSRDAMPDGGDLTMETRTATPAEATCDSCEGPISDGQVVLTVSDTGHGIDEERIETIFEPFFTTKERGKGTGLGLATVHGIVHQNGGHIRVRSEAGEGTTFEVYLPLVDEDVDVESGSDAIEETKGSETILVVEDMEILRRLAVRILKSQGYEVLEAQHGGEALLLCERHEDSIDLLVTDVVMPQMSGPQLYQRLAQIIPDLRVLYMSGYTDDAIARHGVLDAGTNFLQKPFRAEELGVKVRRVLDGPAPPPR